MNHTIKIKEVPHNGKPITKIEISPQSRYIVTYSQEDKSFVGWCGKVSKVIQKKNSYVEYIKNNINPRIELLLGIKDNQDDELNDDNDDSGPLIVDDKVQPYNLDLDISDYKVSDNKIIMYEGNDELAIIYDMKNKKKITLNSSFKKYADDKYKFNFPYYKFTNFLTSGDLATYNVIESKGFKNQLISRKPVILIYSSNNIKDNSWKCKSTHELDDMNTMEINFGGITNGRLWMLSKNIILILDLFTFKYRKIPLEIKGNVDNKMIELKFFKSLMVISIEGVHFIYSDRMDFIIKIIVGSNLENSIKYNTLIKYFLETNGNSNYFDYFNNIQFRLNDQKVFGIFYEKPWMINIKKCDLETYIINNNSIYSEETNNTKESINENIFYIIGKQFTVAEDENEFIKMYIIPNLMNSSENKSGYDMRLKSDNGEIILEAFINNSSQNEIVSSYNIKYSKSWKDIKANNTYILYDETELHIYTFNIEFNKIELQCCYNIKFLKYAFRLYNNNKPAADALRIEEIEEIAQPTDNDGLKMQWILYIINQKSFLVYYGEKLLKSAIKQHNIELIESIYDKTLEIFKEDPNNNIHILSLLCKNMPYLNQKYSEFLSKYYDEMNLFVDSSNSTMIYNNLQHLYSYCNELKIPTKYTFISYFLHKLYILTFLYPLRLFSKLSKFLKSQLYRLVTLAITPSIYPTC
ncbi:11686_t:CDS:2 [Rhizophagus irregularis]|nr:11686_t:CDS:2 [Rhizophagus irregularis]